jgi:SPP1 gp7 family putative phage head morphogenesis protein
MSLSTRSRLLIELLADVGQVNDAYEALFDADEPTVRRVRRRRARGIRFPTAYAYKYMRYLRELIENQKRLLAAALETELLPAIERWERERRTDDAASAVRTDDIEEVVAALERLKAIMLGALDDAILEQEMYEYAHQIRAYCERQWKKTIKSITGIDPLIKNARLYDIVTAHVKEQVSLIKTIPQTYFGDIERVVLNGMRSGSMLKDIKKAIQEVYPVTWKRAGIIARDQCGSFTAAVSDEHWHQAGLTTYIWRNMGDERVRGNPNGRYPRARPSHWDREGQIYSIDEPPEDGHPGEAILCRCFREVVEGEVLSVYGKQRTTRQQVRLAL